MDNERQVIATVSRVNNYIKRLIDSKKVLNDLWVKGEISNYKRHSSGHLYLTLKDEGGVLRAVMFRGAASCLAFTPSDGMKVVARGRIGVYEAGGSYQLYIDEMRPDGMGALHLEYERLKKRLESEGIFDIRHKKPIPRYPSRLGVITAPTGAAVRDIINVASRRYPMAKIIIYPALVQGAGAKESIVRAIEYFNGEKSADTLIVGRGGGSIEDLWAFNEECVARAIYASEIPIISAVGHETDFTIADFVADLRAPTPSAAAEMSVPSADELRRFVKSSQDRMNSAVSSRIRYYRQRLKRLVPGNPQEKINELAQKTDMQTERIINKVMLTITQNRTKMGELCGKLDALSPVKTLYRGYGIPMGKNGVLREVKDFASGTEFDLILRDGTVQCIAK